MGFFSNVAELRAAIKANVAAGQGTQSLVNAVQAKTRPAQPPKPKQPPIPKSVKGLPAGTPIGARLSAKDYRKLMGLE